MNAAKDLGREQERFFLRQPAPFGSRMEVKPLPPQTFSATLLPQRPRKTVEFSGTRAEAPFVVTP